MGDHIIEYDISEPRRALEARELRLPFPKASGTADEGGAEATVCSNGQVRLGGDAPVLDPLTTLPPALSDQTHSAVQVL